MRQKGVLRVRKVVRVVSPDGWVPQKNEERQNGGGRKSEPEDGRSRWKRYKTDAWVVFLKLPAGQITNDKVSVEVAQGVVLQFGGKVLLNTLSIKIAAGEQ